MICHFWGDAQHCVHIVRSAHHCDENARVVSSCLIKVAAAAAKVCLWADTIAAVASISFDEVVHIDTGREGIGFPTDDIIQSTANPSAFHFLSGRANRASWIGIGIYDTRVVVEFDAGGKGRTTWWRASCWTWTTRNLRSVIWIDPTVATTSPRAREATIAVAATAIAHEIAKEAALTTQASLVLCGDCSSCGSGRHKQTNVDENSFSVEHDENFYAMMLCCCNNASCLFVFSSLRL
jgi:hypothetical protein